MGKATYVLGIDPGKTGGFAICDETGLVSVHKLNGMTEHDIAHEWRSMHKLWGLVGYLERVSSSPQMGVVSSFTFGRGYGLLRGLLIGLNIPFHEVTPATWQRKMKCLTKGDKNVSKAAAQRLYPELTMTHAIADAILIAEYGRLEQK